MAKIIVLHGPNLNLLGQREKSIYGSLTLDDINKTLEEMASDSGIKIECYQSNHEGKLVDLIQDKCNEETILLINPGAYTHTSVAIRDAILARRVKVIEIHMSNIYKREEFRHKSYIKDISEGQIIGFGSNSYVFAMQAAISMISNGEVK